MALTPIGGGQDQGCNLHDHSRPGGQPVRTSEPPNLFPSRTSKKPLHVPVRKWIRIGSWPFSTKKSACGKLVSSNRACQIPGGHFRRKKAPAARYLSATGLVKSRGGHFHKKRACGKIPSSNRACQSPDHGCIMDFDNRKVTFRTDCTPLHRIAVQF